MALGTSWNRATSRLGAIVLSTALIAVACGDDSDDRDDSDVSADIEAEGAGSTAIYPGEAWTEADPEEMGFDPEVLADIAAEAEDLDSYCLVVTRDGQLVAEWYWDDTEPATQIEAFSVTKSYTSSLVGLAVDETDLELDDKASDYIEDWAGTESEDITVRNLISNDSGRTWAASLGILEAYGALAGVDDRNDFAVGLGQDDPPGTTWEYNDGAIQALEPILTEATGMEPATYAQEKILEPIGATDSEMSVDTAGNTAMFFALQTTCRDMARYGHLFLQDGVWEGEQILPEGWVQEATGQPSQELSANYGYLWWLNRSGDSVSPGGGEGGAEEVDGADRDVPDAPEDMYWARGLGGQIIQVDPGSGTVVTRMGPGDFDSAYGSAHTTRVVTEALVGEDGAGD